MVPVRSGNGNNNSDLRWQFLELRFGFIKLIWKKSMLLYPLSDSSTQIRIVALILIIIILERTVNERKKYQAYKDNKMVISREAFSCERISKNT